MTLAEIAAVVGGSLGNPEHAATVVSAEAALDSRAVAPGGLFVAIIGERVDGHDYVEVAVAAGAAAVLSARAVEAPCVIVDDPTHALGLLARHVIETLHAQGTLTVHAVTGSQGKTGTKDYLASVLADAAPTVATAGNNNNELGVPLTVLKADATTRHLVVEMGARGIGHVAELCQIAPPQVAAVLNVGSAHVGEFGSRENIAVAKGEIVEALDANGTAVLNLDDPLVADMAPRTSARVLTFSAAGAPEAHLRAVDLTYDALGRPRFDLVHAGSSHRVELTQIGDHQVANALAAAAMALGAGLDLAQIADSLSRAGSFSRWRMEPHERTDGLLVINDAYNANPESMVAAVAALARVGESRAGRTVAVLGEMRELGDDTLTAHRSVGEQVAELGIDVVVAVGDVAAPIAEAARTRPQWQGVAIATASRDEAVVWLRENVVAADAVLVKASRGAALEHVVEELLVEGTAVL